MLTILSLLLLTTITALFFNCANNAEQYKSIIEKTLLDVTDIAELEANKKLITTYNQTVTFLNIGFWVSLITTVVVGISTVPNMVSKLND